MSFDKLDLAIMKELEADARQPVQAIAKTLGVKRTTVRYRLNRLIDQGILTIAAVSKADLLGYQFLLLMGINVSPGTADTVGNQLARLPSTMAVSLAAGRYSIVAWAVLRDQPALARFMSKDLAGISDITAIEMMPSYHWVKDVWRYFEPKKKTITRTGLWDNPSDLDLSIIKAMQLDPRQSIAKLAKTLGCSKPVAKAKLDRLVDDGIIEFAIVVNRYALGYDIGVGILIKSKPEKIRALADELSSQDSVRYVCLVVGQWQIFLWAQFQNGEYLHRYISETLPSLDGITEFDVVHLLKQTKYTTTLPDWANLSPATHFPPSTLL